MRKFLLCGMIVFLLFCPVFAIPQIGNNCYYNCEERANDCAFGCWAAGASEPDWGCFIYCEQLRCMCESHCDNVPPMCMQQRPAIEKP